MIEKKPQNEAINYRYRSSWFASKAENLEKFTFLVSRIKENAFVGKLIEH